MMQIGVTVSRNLFGLVLCSFVLILSGIMSMYTIETAHWRLSDFLRQTCKHFGHKKASTLSKKSCRQMKQYYRADAKCAYTLPMITCVACTL